MDNPGILCLKYPVENQARCYRNVFKPVYFELLLTHEITQLTKRPLWDCSCGCQDVSVIYIQARHMHTSRTSATTLACTIVAAPSAPFLLFLNTVCRTTPCVVLASVFITHKWCEKIYAILYPCAIGLIETNQVSRAWNIFPIVLSPSVREKTFKKNLHPKP